jgi:hypothetical protein
MTDTVRLFLLVSVLAFLVGFAIRRGSICAVAAFLKPSRGQVRSDRSRSAFRRRSRPAGSYSGQGRYAKRRNGWRGASATGLVERQGAALKRRRSAESNKLAARLPAARSRARCASFQSHPWTRKDGQSAPADHLSQCLAQLLVLPVIDGAVDERRRVAFKT